MRHIWLIFWLILGCSKPEKSIPNVEVLFDSAKLIKKNDILHYENQIFDGYITERNFTGKLISKSGYLNGKLEGLQQKWFNDGTKKEVRFYHRNSKVGKHEGWYKNGIKKFEYLIENDIPVGVHREWFSNGKPFSLFTYYKMGQPEGLQKMWFQNGQIRANYIVKNKRRFGLLGAKGCMGMQERKNMI